MLSDGQQIERVLDRTRLDAGATGNARFGVTPIQVRSLASGFEFGLARLHTLDESFMPAEGEALSREDVEK